MFVVWCFTINFLKCSNVYHEQAPSPSPPSTSIFAYFMRKYVVKFAHFHAVPICFVLFRFGCAYVYIRFDGSEKIRKCYDLTFPFLKVIDGKSKFQTLTLGMKILSHLRRERTSESAHTHELSNYNRIYIGKTLMLLCVESEWIIRFRKFENSQPETLAQTKTQRTKRAQQWLLPKKMPIP